MHPALFLLNSCILYVEQIIQKKGGDHIQLLETIVHCSAQIMISGYDTPLYNDYLHTWDTLRIQNQTTSGVIREEIVWMNYTHQLSLYDFGIL